jgi:MFS family permease
MLVISRFIQGAGEALASPAALSLVALVFSGTRERARALGIWGGITGMGATVGVVLSGVLTTLANWRWNFFLNLPLALVALLLVPLLLKEERGWHKGQRRIDLLGTVLVTGGLVAVVDGLLAASRFAWNDGSVLAPLLGGLVALLAFVVVEMPTGCATS